MLLLRQATAATVKMGPFVSSSDGNTLQTALTIQKADVKLSRNGGGLTSASADQGAANVGASYDANGEYTISLDATDTGTLGRLKISIIKAGALPVWVYAMVLPQMVYDALVAGTDYLDVSAVQWLGTAMNPLQAGRVDSYVGANNDKTGYQLAAAQPAYAPAKAGDAMTLTAGERTAVANEVEAQIIDDTDSEKVLQAITDKIAAVNPSLDDLTLGGIAAAVRDEVERVGGMLIGVKAKTDNLPGSPAATGDAMTLEANAIGAAQLAATAIAAIQAGLSTLTQLQAQAAATAALDAYDPPTRAEATADKQEILAATGSPLQAADARLDTIAGAAEELAPLIEGGQFTVEALANGPAGEGGGLTAQEVWEYDGPRTVTQPAARLADIDNAGTITLTRGVTVAEPLNDVANLANRTKLWFTVKKRLVDEDSEAVIQIEETAGLLYLNGAPATGEAGAASAADGSLEVDAEAGTVTIHLALTASEELPIGNNLYYDLKVLTAAGLIPAPVRGRLNVVSAVTRAVS